jgi:hypothetical protein
MSDRETCYAAMEIRLGQLYGLYALIVHRLESRQISSPYCVTN